MIFQPYLNKSEEKTYVICSPMEGVLLNNGEPLRATKIIRKLTWNANSGGLIEEFYTDDNGRFALPSHEDSFNMGSVLTQFVANQVLQVEVDGKTEEIWISGQLTGEMYGETAGKKPEELVCDLSNDMARVYGENQSLLATKCRWTDIQLDDIDDE